MSQFVISENTLADQVRNAFPFGIRKLPLRGPGNIETPHYGLFKTEEDEMGLTIGECCSRFSPKQGYIPHQTDDVVALCEAAAPLFEGRENPVVSARFENGHHVVIQPSREHRLSLFDGQDNTFPRLIIRASLNGNSFSVSLGMYRDVCQNLQMMRSVDSCQVSIRHDSNLRKKMNDLILQCSSLKDGWEAMQNRIRMMSEMEVNASQFIESILPPPSPDSQQAKLTRWENNIRAVRDRLWKESESLGFTIPTKENGWKTNLWLAYNAITGFAQHDKTRRGRQDEITRQFSALSDDLSKAADQKALAILTA